MVIAISECVDTRSCNFELRVEAGRPSDRRDGQHALAAQGGQRLCVAIECSQLVETQRDYGLT